MEEHQKRVLNEKDELDEKIEKLSQFTSGSTIYTNLGDDEKFRLDTQLYVMQIYSRILSERIMNFGK